MTTQRSRRDLLRAAGGLSALTLLNCGALVDLSDAGTGGGTATGGGSSATSGGGETTGGGSANTGGGTANTGGGEATGGGTANTGGGSGGTFMDAGLNASLFAVGSGAFLTGKRYGDPFTTGLGSACSAYKDSTEGPCHSNTFFRADVSDGLIGLPTRFELLVVDAQCNPVPDAIVELWYASPAGTYSKAAEAIDAGTGYGGALSDLNVGFCTGNDAVALASSWLRGYQVSGADGRLTLDGIFPGWYSGRTTHVHFIVTAGGQRSVTSQLFFDETLTAAVYTGHGSYSARGNKDTTNAGDNVARGLTLSDVTMAYAQQSDGALVCWKAIAISA